MKDFNHVGSCAKVVSASVESIIKEGRLCVNLGGDHSISKLISITLMYQTINSKTFNYNIQLFLCKNTYNYI